MRFTSIVAPRLFLCSSNIYAISTIKKTTEKSVTKTIQNEKAQQNSNAVLKEHDPSPNDPNRKTTMKKNINNLKKAMKDSQQYNQQVLTDYTSMCTNADHDFQTLNNTLIGNQSHAQRAISAAGTHFSM